MSAALTLDEILCWSDETTHHWLDFLAAHPEVQQLPCGIYATANVLGLVRHIVVVEMRYGQRLAGLPVTAYEDVPENSLEALTALHAGTMDRLRAVLADPEQDWTRQLEFKTLGAGTLSASQRKIVAHALLHGIRHWAQIATLARSAGYPPPFAGDLLISAALD
ncbi:MAG TPA: DinB family protein [Terracidiphilus sp.]|nr:DinB family protein [Terracidiphilus sp.]